MWESSDQQWVSRRCRSILAVFFLVAFTGCPTATPPAAPVSQALRGQELEIVTPQSLNLPTRWEVMRQEWSSQTGASTRFFEYDDTTGVPDLQEPVSESGGRLILVPFRQLCDLDRRFTRLTALDTRDLFKGLRERVLSREREVIAIPVSAPVLVVYYRADLLRAAGLKAPETWDQYQELIESLDSWARGLVAVEPLSSDFRATMFFARALAYCKHPENYSVWFDVDTAKPTLSSPGFQEALEVSRRAWNKLPPEVATYSPTDCRNLLLAGKAAMALGYEPSSAIATDPLNVEEMGAVPRIDGIEVGICRLPGSRRVYNRNSKKWDTIPAGTVHAPALCGFSGLLAAVMLPTDHPTESAAFQLLESLNSTSLFDEAFANLPKSPCRESQVNLAPAWFGPYLSTEEATQYADAVAQSLRDPELVYELPVIGAQEFRRATAEVLEPLIRGHIATDDAANRLQADFTAIVEKLGIDAVRESHRRGLGMSPTLKMSPAFKR